MGADYTLSSISFIFAAGQTTASITITAVDDAIEEPPEDFTLMLQASPFSESRVFISDNDDGKMWGCPSTD